ncbi:probable RNA polymerase II nuclear localization protein SLC7A6OS [Cimex lectularius]|uniref:Probable RNA polymerase II nuclear localization protein SLC7A6OS n=1 Tax=Cimex lectularius TaxID=79782 RepID=A0A8I6THM6_CIMLE|nr:probable RNA polymerase II nuclear localization protein SLC7A6OS [Cimex lectularius]
MAFVRVKRRPEEDPIDVLLLAAKRLKTEDEEPLTNVFRFLTTVEKDKDIKEHLEFAKHLVPKKKVHFQKQDVSSITEKLKAENKLFSHDNRLKVVNCFRAIPHDEEQGESDQRKAYTIVDIESIPFKCEESKDSSSSNASSSTTEQYLYDLYYTTAPGDFNDLQLEHTLSAHEVDEKLLFGDYIADKEEEDNNQMDDEDDSNDENNWRNEYPEDENSSIDEDDMLCAVKKIKHLNLNGEYSSDLSTDDFDDDLIYGVEDYGNYYYDSSGED